MFDLLLFCQFAENDGFPKDYKSFCYKDTCTRMFIAALFTVAKTWNQPKCPSTIDWIGKMWHIYTMKYMQPSKTMSLCVCRDMDEPGNHHSQQTDRRAEDQTPHVLTHRWVFFRQISTNDYFFEKLEPIDVFLYIEKDLFYCILDFGVHVKNMQDCCIGTHKAA